MDSNEGPEFLLAEGISTREGACCVSHKASETKRLRETGTWEARHDSVANTGGGDAVSYPVLRRCPFCDRGVTVIKHARLGKWRVWHSCDVAGACTIKWQDSAEKVASLWNGSEVIDGRLRFSYTRGLLASLWRRICHWK